MANFASMIKIPSFPEGLGTDFDRSEDKEFRIAGNVPCEIYVATSDNLGTDTLPTGFNRVLGGYCFSLTEGVYKPAVAVNPLKTDASVAEVSNLPLSADNHLIVVYGDK